jgi:hypothetical protein
MSKNTVKIPFLTINEVEAIWRECSPWPGVIQIDIHEFSKKIVLKLREKVNGNQS